MPDTERKCAKCGVTPEDSNLEPCMVCGKWFCASCSFKRTGRRFCSEGCAKDFFWGEGEEEDDTKELPDDYY